MASEEIILNYTPKTENYEMLNPLKIWDKPSASFKSVTNRFPDPKFNASFPTCSYLHEKLISSFDIDEKGSHYFKSEPDRTKGLKTNSSEYPNVSPQSYSAREGTLKVRKTRRRCSSSFMSSTRREFQKDWRMSRRHGTPGPGTYLRERNISSFREATRRKRRRQCRPSSSKKLRKNQTKIGFLSSRKKVYCSKNDVPTPTRYHRNSLHTIFRKPKKKSTNSPAFQSLTHGRDSYIPKDHATKDVEFCRPKNDWRKRSFNRRKDYRFGSSQKRFYFKQPYEELYMTKIRSSDGKKVIRKLRKKIVTGNFYGKEYGYIPEGCYKPMNDKIAGKVNRK